MADVRQRLATLLEQRGAPGAQYLVVRDGVPLLELSHGLADARYAAPVTPTATFNAYSITKPFTTAAVLALTKVGALDLDEPIGRAFGVASLADYGSVRETVLHRAGLRNPYPLCWVHRADAHRDFDEAAFIRARMDALTGTRRRRAPSGYSNLGYLLLGLAVERAWRNGSFVEAMRALVLDPLGAAAGDCLGFTIGKPDEHAHGHLRRRGWMDLTLGLLAGDRSLVLGIAGRHVVLAPHQVNGSAYGGLIANARGLARFGQAVLGTGVGFSPWMRRELIEEAPGPGPRRSLGFFAGRLASHDWFAHAGGGLGGYSELRLYPSLGAVSVLMTNGPGFVDARLLDTLDTAWLSGPD